MRASDSPHAATYVLTDDTRRLITTFGSNSIYSVTYRGAWAMIGRVGATPGTVLEYSHINSCPEHECLAVVFSSLQLEVEFSLHSTRTCDTYVNAGT